MFTSGSHTTIKELCLKYILHLLTCFGMGVNPPDVHQIYHYDPPNDSEMYVPEVGRGKRDGYDLSNHHFCRSCLVFEAELIQG